MAIELNLNRADSVTVYHSDVVTECYMPRPRTDNHQDDHAIPTLQYSEICGAPKF